MTPGDDDEDYHGRVVRLSAQTSDELRSARNDLSCQKEALVLYFKRGSATGISTGELVDYLLVSSPSIAELAGYSEDAIAVLAELCGSLDDG